ncbi:MAG: hypothetical protein ABJA67_03520, partial [Chthonomonadales bacterium]
MVNYISGLVFWVLAAIGVFVVTPIANMNPLLGIVVGIIWLFLTIVLSSAIRLAENPQNHG